MRKGANAAELSLEVRRCLSEGCPCNLDSATPVSVFPRGSSVWRSSQNGAAVSTFALCCPCSGCCLSVFSHDSSNSDLETKLSYFKFFSLTLVMYECVLLKLETHPQNPGNPMEQGGFTLFFSLIEKEVFPHILSTPCDPWALLFPLLFIDGNVISRDGPQ